MKREKTQKKTNTTAAGQQRKVMNPFLDWSFKYLFGTEHSKENLLGFLNLLLMPQYPITDIQYINNEVLPVSQELRGCTFDIICKDSNEDKYLVEMQNSPAVNIKERIIYYTCRLIDRMGKRGSEWDYSDIKRVYSICLMDFTYESSPKLRRDIQLYDLDECKPFSDKLNIILLQIPCLKAENLQECNGYYEYLLFLLQEMKRGMKTVDELKQEVSATRLPQATKDLFYRVLETADVGSLSEKELMRYETDLKNYMDTMSCIKYAKLTGKQEGIEEGRAEGLVEGEAKRNIEIAKSMKSNGIDTGLIAKCTGLSEEEIEKL